MSDSQIKTFIKLDGKKLEGKELIELFVQELSDSLKSEGKDGDNDIEMFLSEDDLKFSLSQTIAEVFRKHNLYSKVILEYPIEDKKFYDGKRCYIDVYFEYDTRKYFIELKFVTNKAGCTRYGTNFELRNHSAINFRLYSVYRDIERMKNIKKYFGADTRAFVLLITNQPYFWRTNGGVSENYPLVDPKEDKKAKHAKDEKISRTATKEVFDRYLKVDGNKKRRYAPNGFDELTESYAVKWENFKPKDPTNDEKSRPFRFRYLIIDLNESEKK